MKFQRIRSHVITLRFDLTELFDLADNVRVVYVFRYQYGGRDGDEMPNRRSIYIIAFYLRFRDTRCVRVITFFPNKQ